MNALLAVLQTEAEGGSTGSFLDSFGSIETGGLVRGLIMIVVGIPILRLVSKSIRSWLELKGNPQAGLVTGKFVYYIGASILAVTVLREFGFSLGPLLGAAGVLGIALGFASQTSVSNVISGLFLIVERPFIVNDLIQVGDVTGRVLSIDTISVKLRTFDNRMVRIPNETLVKSQVINITRFPIRRVDVTVGVAYKEDAERVRTILLEVADQNPLSLMEPEPIVMFSRFGESSIDFLFGVWATQENFLALKNSIQEDVKARFDAEGVEIPFPHRTLYVGSATDAFPVQVTTPTGQNTATDDAESAPGGDAESA